MLQEKMDGLDFAAVCMKTLNVDSRTAYEIGLVKVVGWQVIDTFSSYMNPVAPLSKALRKSLPEKLIQKIDEAPKLLDLWPRISHFFESHVLYGSEASTRRLIYCVDACGLDFSPQAMPFGRGSTPEPAKVILANGFDPDDRPAISFAIEWAASRIKSRIKTPISTFL
jgi:inhibitor of KinA sporulation pathway (predicted exonuclease)